MRTGLVTLLLLAVALAAGAPSVVGSLLGARAARQGAEARVSASLSGFRFQQPDRLQKIELMARILATDPVLAGYLDEMIKGGEEVKLLDLLEGYQDRLAFDVAAIFDTAAKRQASVGVPIVHDASLAATLDTARERDRARGVWRDGANLYHAAALPVVRDFELLGFVVVGLAVDDALARQLASLGAETVLFAVTGTAGGAVPLGGTAPPAQAAQLVDALAERGDVLTQAISLGETVASVAITSAGEKLMAGVEPLRDAAGKTVGAVIATASPARAAPGFSRIPLAALVAGLAALVAGILCIGWLTGRSQRPWRLLAAYTQSLAAGEEPAAPKALPGDAGRMVEALDRLANDRRQQRALAHAATAAASRAGGGRGDGNRGPRAETQETTLLATELRRFADPKLGYDAEANLERFATDLRRLRAALRDRQGRIVAVAGHRVLAVFQGDGAAFRALSAAADANRALAEGESVFDQPEPPVMALATGPVVTGRLAWGTGAGPVTLGLPIQQLESLLREGTPGDICLTKNVYGELASAFTEAGAERQPQRGVMSPQPLYAVPAEVAAKVTGAVAASVESEPGRRQLADVAIGVTLASRFEILDELGADSQSVRFMVRDRERGGAAMMALLRPQLIAAQEDLERLATAFRRLRGLDHPHVVQVWDFGEAEGLPYVLMPFVAGQRLRSLLEAGPLSPPALLGLARQLAAGLGAGHAAGVVHGDVRPEHVLIDGSGHVRIGGFAVSSGAQAGATATFRAPERIQGGDGGMAGDIYGFGATLFESLAGQTPFSGATPGEVQKQQMAGPPQPLGQLVDVPAALADLIAQCLDRDPASRPASFEAIAASLETQRA